MIAYANAKYLRNHTSSGLYTASTLYCPNVITYQPQIQGPTTLSASATDQLKFERHIVDDH